MKRHLSTNQTAQSNCIPYRRSSTPSASNLRLQYPTPAFPLDSASHLHFATPSWHDIISYAVCSHNQSLPLLRAVIHTLSILPGQVPTSFTLLHTSKLSCFLFLLSIAFLPVNYLHKRWDLWYRSSHSLNNIWSDADLFQNHRLRSSLLVAPLRYQLQCQLPTPLKAASRRGH